MSSVSDPGGEHCTAAGKRSRRRSTAALYLGMLDADFSIVESPDLVDARRKLITRYQRAIDASQQAPG
jgi:hypothetical protein